MPPYRFGRHPITDALDEYVSDPAQAATLLDELRRNVEKTAFATALLAKDAADHRHLFEEVFGKAKVATGSRETEEVRRGRARRLLYRDGIRAALELAFGIGHDDPVPDPATEVASIDTLWGCGQPMDQAWVGWRGTGATRRVVLTLFSDEPATGWDDSLLATVDRPFPPQPADLATTGIVVFHDDGAGATRVSRVIHPDLAGPP